MRPFRASLAATAVALALAAADASAQFTNVYFFGDSLTDSGSYKPVLPPGTGLFTTNPGPVWSQVFAQRYGLTAIPANQGGTNFAQGGARVTGLPGVPNSPPTGTATPIATQVAQFVATRPARPRRALRRCGAAPTTSSSSWARCPAGAITPAQLQANVGAAAVQPGAAGRRARGGGRAQHRRVQPAGHRQDAGRRRVGPGGADQRDLGPLQQHADRRARRARHADDARQHLRAVQRGPRQSRRRSASRTSRRRRAARRRRSCARARTSSRRTPRSTFVFADGVHPTTAGHALIAAGRCVDDRRSGADRRRSPKRRSPSSRRRSARSTRA